MKQLNLFEDRSFKSRKQSSYLMTKEELINWKERVFEFQQKALQERIKQTTLFNLKPTHYDSDEINPFSLTRYSSHFHRMPETNDKYLIYFIIDDSFPLLLYVGETMQTAKQRWSNHDCKEYIMSYKQLHRKHNLPDAINASFWFETPRIRKHRLQLETELILKFRSPFNKECWQFWGQPFRK
jgi:hypothetical protein